MLPVVHAVVFVDVEAPEELLQEEKLGEAANWAQVKPLGRRE